MYGSSKHFIYLGAIHLFIATLFTYLFITFLGRKVSAFWVLIFTVSHLSFLHIKRMIEDYGGWSMDATTIYMMSICKFSAMTFAYEDGGKDESQIKNKFHKSK
jgi:lysophospholipid acyltransferase